MTVKTGAKKLRTKPTLHNESQPKDSLSKATAQAKHTEPYTNPRTLLHWPGGRPGTPPQECHPMQQPLEEKIAYHEDSAQRHEQTLARLTATAENQDQLQGRLLAIQEKIASLLEELTRDSATRRFWLRLAQRYGRLDDEQNGAQPDAPA